jgi:hypothetical protein
MDEKKYIEEYIQSANNQIPSYAWNSTVPIVTVINGAVYHYGTGTLFSVADHYFLVTAAHVLKSAIKDNLTLAIGGSENNGFIALQGNALVSKGGQYGSVEDTVDVGVFQLSQDIVKQINRENKFINYSNVDAEVQSPKSVYVLFGYPAVWSSPSKTIDDSVNYKRLQYTTYSYGGRVSQIDNYQERLHILLDAEINQAFNFNTSPIQPVDLNGNPKPVNEEFGGISGCSVWRIGDYTKSLSNWEFEIPKLVGVETGVYYKSKAIKATRWIAVNTLLYEAFPELRPAMQILL